MVTEATWSDEDSRTLRSLRDRDIGWAPVCIKCKRTETSAFHSDPDTCETAVLSGGCRAPEEHHPFEAASPLDDPSTACHWLLGAFDRSVVSVAIIYSQSIAHMRDKEE